MVDPLVARAAAGDAHAWRMLVAREGPIVWTLCARSDPDADDAFQDAWERILKALPGFDPAGTASVRTWMLAIVHRMLVDRWRRRRVRAADPLDEDLPAFEKDDRVNDLESAIARLPEAHRRVVTLHHLHELDLDAIAVIEGVPVGTLKSRLHRARAALAVMLSGAALESSSTPSSRAASTPRASSGSA